jgi:hypothetical protein
MALQGDLKTIPLREILGWLAHSRASGILSVSRGMVVRQFHLRRGRVTLSGSTDQELLLGHLLVERGIVDRAQLQEALATREGSRLRLGAVLTRAGMVSPSALRAVLTEKGRRLLLDVLSWTDGDFFFDTGTARKRPAVAAIVGLAEVLALPSEVRLDPPDPDDVVITDEDIVEIIELAGPTRRRPRKPPAPSRAPADPM